MIQKILALVFTLLFVAACQSGGVDSPSSHGSGYNNAVGYGGSGYSSADITPGTQADLDANVGSLVFFGYDSARLSPEAQGTLQRQVEWLNRHTYITITVEGHCDERGTREYNLALGERRASAVKNYLVSLGVDASRISTISYGKERPAVIGSDADSLAQNRRGVVVVN